jgi:hypothetical protein
MYRINVDVNSLHYSISKQVFTQSETLFYDRELRTYIVPECVADRTS